MPKIPSGMDQKPPHSPNVPRLLPCFSNTKLSSLENFRMPGNDFYRWDRDHALTTAGRRKIKSDRSAQQIDPAKIHPSLFTLFTTCAYHRKMDVIVKGQYNFRNFRSCLRHHVSFFTRKYCPFRINTKIEIAMKMIPMTRKAGLAFFPHFSLFYLGFKL